MSTKPELLTKDTTAADGDLIMKTATNGVTKTITALNFFNWLWGKIKGKTKSALDTSDATAPVNTTAINAALGSYYNKQSVEQLLNGYTEKGTSTISDFNAIIPIQLISTRFDIGYNAQNMPAGSGTWVVQTSRRSNNLVQIAKRMSSTLTPSIYTRSGTLSDNIATWNNWEKLATESDLTNYQRIKKITLSANQTLTLTHNNSAFAIKITIQGGRGFSDYGCFQYQGYGNGTYDHIFELLKGSSFNYTKEENRLSFTTIGTTYIIIEYLIGDETSIIDTIS